MPMLPTDAKERKKIPLWSGVFKYFPDALIELARLSYVGNEQHNPGEKLRWAREKSSDHEDTILRHLLEAGTVDVDGIRHSVKALWRCAALVQLELEAAKNEVRPVNGQPPNILCRLCGGTSDGERNYNSSMCDLCYCSRDAENA